MTPDNGNHGRGTERPCERPCYGLEEPSYARPDLPGNVVVRPDADDLIDALAADLVVHAENCVREFGDFHVALSGGSPFEALYRRLMYDPNYRRLPWRRAHLWFVEECCVPSDHAESRFRMVGELIGDHADIPAEQFHTIRAESETAAVDYDRQLRETLAWREKGQDRLDYALLTMDAEGGTAGMRPGDRAGGDESALVRAYRRPDDPAPDRVALALPFLNATRFIAVLVTGAPLAGAVRRLAGDGCAAGDMPIAGLAPINGELTWYLDGPACGDGTG